MIRDGVLGHLPQHGGPVGDFGVLLRIGDTAAGAKDNDLRDVAVVHPASQPITVKPFARDEFDENHRQASKAIHGMSIAQARLFRQFAELLFKTHGHQLHREDDENRCYGHHANDQRNRVPLAPDQDSHTQSWLVQRTGQTNVGPNRSRCSVRLRKSNLSIWREWSCKPFSQWSSTIEISVICMY